MYLYLIFSINKFLYHKKKERKKGTQQLGRTHIWRWTYTDFGTQLGGAHVIIMISPFFFFFFVKFHKAWVIMLCVCLLLPPPLSHVWTIFWQISAICDKQRSQRYEISVWFWAMVPTQRRKTMGMADIHAFQVPGICPHVLPWHPFNVLYCDLWSFWIGHPGTATKQEECGCGKWRKISGEVFGLVQWGGVDMQETYLFKT